MSRRISAKIRMANAVEHLADAIDRLAAAQTATFNATIAGGDIEPIRWHFDAAKGVWEEISDEGSS